MDQKHLGYPVVLVVLEVQLHQGILIFIFKKIDFSVSMQLNSVKLNCTRKARVSFFSFISSKSFGSRLTRGSWSTRRSYAAPRSRITRDSVNTV